MCTGPVESVAAHGDSPWLSSLADDCKSISKDVDNDIVRASCPLITAVLGWVCMEITRQNLVGIPGMPRDEFIAIAL